MIQLELSIKDRDGISEVLLITYALLEYKNGLIKDYQEMDKQDEHDWTPKLIDQLDVICSLCANINISVALLLTAQPKA